MEVANLALDIFLILLMVLVIGYGFLLNRRLKVFRDNRLTMEQSKSDFNDALEKAEYVLNSLKGDGGSAAGLLRKDLKQCETLGDELRIMIQAGDRVASRLERSIEVGWAVDNGLTKKEITKKVVKKTPAKSRKKITGSKS